MSKCKNEVLMNKVGIDKVNNQMEIDFNVMNNLPDCKRIKADKYVSVDGTPSFNRYRIPDNQFECMRTGCINSGTLYNEGKATVYRAQYDATEFANGVITFYEIGGGDKAVVKVSNTADFTDADSYTVNLSDMATGKDGYTAVVVDLSKAPTATIGEGWSPIATGAYISIEITVDDEEADLTNVGISSIGIFDTLDDFETSNVVKIACLTGVDGSIDFDTVEATCFGNGGLDADNFEGFELTITGKAVTPNYNLLNPLAKKGSAVTGFDITTTQKTIESTDGFGQVTLADMDQDACGYLAAQLADSCNVADSWLTRLTVPSKVDVDEGHFLAVDAGEGATMLLFNEAHIGAPVIISYPKTAEITETILSADSIDDVRTTMSYVRTYTDGTKERLTFNNVLVTSFPLAIGEDETEFSFTIAIRKDANGNFGTRHIIAA